MQCSLEQMNDCERSPNRTNLRVNFNEKGAEVKERREKFLTAKYGSHQMSLIRKRLAVEMWLYDELQKLFDPPSEAIDVDIDEILDMDTDDIRRSHLICENGRNRTATFVPKKDKIGRKLYPAPYNIRETLLHMFGDGMRGTFMTLKEHFISTWHVNSM
ncbi:uncharacterized protein LOC105230188 isoform X1 [Bactrocera dorsalis]|uniref:Uncharacterized protein LOC105230188 isoform X1 n=1 Tax=Bactrocera dorsalis TaxID=27457 RepID=A0ABM3JNT0_BACDO|nr:uncharacterized protein LOC105230188 isoform X1 [Bactrocera dorsalis]XP_049310880.1 uncharacterized protein LOC105230188 isoform X1 [Bactrocera dorsalis]XP_049310883.1 uncharacterized protein LOC105230188 isoform X1 [Bactrocera dorsalis]XP_049310887.1 uncharacterized protein LOC105230188 isoform X1 [Bactrocera dorsalis]XP_049310888.1 uncharacterized protein LOC105230188 isoform X1 [Bactrocera dorsalis]XP_049310892.1 uncharacterized protein LOC105230188 isoform X1 [Bactrocera dorsalis]XP_04